MHNLGYLSILTKRMHYMMKRRFEVKYSFLLMMILLLVSCNDEKPLFVKLDVATSGITFKNTLEQTDDFNIIDYLYFYNGGGVSIGDINGDSLPDIFFSGNQVSNKLYLNKGNLKFEDITEKARVKGESTWNTGSIMGDVNGDGLLDIYVCAVVGLKHLTGHNELFINNGDNTFTESSESYGLDFDTYGSSAAFIDYDLDGDLDIYLLNHAIHTAESFGHSKVRNERNYATGDKLLRNNGDKFEDVSLQANIIGGVNSYGLGISISDFNQDGFPDIFVGNDFHEDDYYYINQGDGTFQEKGKSAFTHMSRFSMGNDVADINHDGYPDLISLDMLPKDEVVLKRSEADENITISKMRTEQYGYYYQYERNMMQVNQGNGEFLETGLLSNVAATDWSWSALFSDFDQDGNQDLFISNGIPRRPNDLDYIKYVSSEQIVNTIGATKLVDQKAMALMPSGKVKNYVFKGSGSYEFEDMSDSWLPDEQTSSTATAFGDLDNDGDLDLVINNVDDAPSIYINQTNSSANYLKVHLKYIGANKLGVGSSVSCYSDGLLQYKELYTVRGFQSSSEPIIHFGLGKNSIIDSLVIVWPDRTRQALKDLTVNKTITVSYEKSDLTFNDLERTSEEVLFAQVDPKSIGITFKHIEDNYSDFDRLKLLPYQQSDKGPATAIGDLNNDGLQDIYFGGSKRIPGEIYLQTNSGFEKSLIVQINKDSINEDVVAVIEDFDGDGKNDLIIGTGGADFYNKSEPLLDTYYKSSDSSFLKVNMPEYYENASCIKKYDFDSDGDIDVFIGNQSESNDFGKIPRSGLFQNKDGNFIPVQPELFDELGMITDATWDDYNKDGRIDLIVLGEWMSPLFLKNVDGKFVKDDVLTSDLNGLWQSIIPFDIDQDGDNDFVIGNWGLNSKYNASSEYPLLMYYNDFDNNGKSETVIAIEKEGKYYPLDPFDMIAGQIVSLHKKFTSYKEFAGKTLDEVFSKELLDSSEKFSVHQLASGYLKNNNGQFNFVPFGNDLQLSPILSLLEYDFDRDGSSEIIIGGNYFRVHHIHGRFGSFNGAIVKNEKEVLLGKTIGTNFINKSVRHFNIISLGEDKYLLVTLNDDKAQVYKLRK